MKGIKRLLLAIVLCVGAMGAQAQTVVGSGDVYNFDYLTPKTYEIGGITFDGAENFDTRVVQLVAGLQVGDKIKLPGDKVSSAIENLWKQGMFEDVQIRVTRVQGSIVFLKIVLRERPRLNHFSFTGVKKGEADKIKEEMHLMTGDVVTENLLRTSTNKIKGYYIDKGYTRVEVTPVTTPDSNGRVNITYQVNRGKKVKIDSLIFEGNEKVSDFVLQNKMEKTHDVHYAKYWYRPWRIFTKGFWKKSRYIENDFQEDLNKVIAYYNEEGYRDARVVSDTVWDVPQDELNISSKKKAKQDRVKVKVNVYEGQKFYFRNITFSGNTVYPDDVLHRSLRIEKGDPYNRTVLEENLKYNPSGTDITSLYMDNGYLFFKAMPVEVAVEGDSIDIEIRIIEDKQARIRNVWVEGNTITNDKIIMRELHTRPGDLFSRDAVIRSQRELVTLGYFKQESIEPVPRPNPKDGTVDIVYKVEEGPTSQLNVQGGYGGGMIIGQVGINLNNFSVRNIFNKDAWVPLPAGDGQKLSLQAAANTYYYTINASFTEPWLGGRRPQSLTGSIYYNHLQKPYTKRSDPSYYSMAITGAGLSFTRRLKWPDDYFIMSHGISYKHYLLNNYSAFSSTLFTDGTANDISYAFSLSRNSFDSPFYTRSGSEISINTYITPPFSLMNGRDYAGATPQEKYRWVEYYKINIKGAWMLNLVGDVVLSTRFRFGFMGYYNKDIGLSPFGRYMLGGDGLTSWNFDGREIVPLRGYDNNAVGASTEGGGSVFDRFTIELRQPIVESSSATFWVLAFLEGGNCWSDLSEFQPFKMYNSAGLGVRVYLPMLGLIGVDWGYGFDGGGIGGSHFHFSIGQSLD
ncbi:MAG: outer membrane protein assembly factor BamA [Bacteroidales bacterium]|nr:outer membrane protein assembly factor BamA [Bacteroidales bacterium]